MIIPSEKACPLLDYGFPPLSNSSLIHGECRAIYRLCGGDEMPIHISLPTSKRLFFFFLKLPFNLQSCFLITKEKVSSHCIHLFLLILQRTSIKLGHSTYWWILRFLQTPSNSNPTSFTKSTMLFQLNAITTMKT